MRIEMMVGGVNLFVNGNFENLNDTLKRVVQACDFGREWGMNASVSIGGQQWYAELRWNRFSGMDANDGVGYEEMTLCVLKDGVMQRDRIISALKMDVNIQARRLFAEFFAHCLFEAVNELNRQGNFKDVALRGKISDYLNGSEYGRELIESIIDPVKN